jgi:hypothetical protein
LKCICPQRLVLLFIYVAIYIATTALHQLCWQHAVKHLAHLPFIVLHHISNVYLFYLFSTQVNFEKLHFKIQCDPNLKSRDIIPSSCVAIDDGPVEGKIGQRTNSKTTGASNILLDLLRPDDTVSSSSSSRSGSSSGNSSGKEDDDASFQETYAFSEAIGSTLLNGLPVLGLDDWVALSDFMNANIAASMRRRLMEYTSIKGRFINLLGVRDLQLAFVPNNCWTKAFINHLNATTKSFKVCMSQSDCHSILNESHYCMIWGAIDNEEHNII